MSRTMLQYSDPSLDARTRVEHVGDDVVVSVPRTRFGFELARLVIWLAVFGALQLIMAVFFWVWLGMPPMSFDRIPWRPVVIAGTEMLVAAGFLVLLVWATRVQSILTISAAHVTLQQTFALHWLRRENRWNLADVGTLRPRFGQLQIVSAKGKVLCRFPLRNRREQKWVAEQASSALLERKQRSKAR